jgi:hypothetical protein
LQNPQTVEITASAAYNTPTSSKTTQTSHLTTENPSNVISESYVAYFNSQIATNSNQSDPEKTRCIDTN